MWWETPRCRAARVAPEMRTARIGRPPSAAPRSPRRRRPARRDRARARADDPGPDRARRRRETLAPRPRERRRQSRRRRRRRRRRRPQRPRPREPALLQRPHRVREGDRQRAAGKLHVRDTHALPSPAQTGATWLCSEQQTTGIPPRAARRARPPPRRARAATCSGVYGSFITCAPGSAGSSRPRVRFAYRTSKPPEPSPSSRACDVDEHLVPSSTGPVSARVGDAGRAVDLEPRETLEAFEHRRDRAAAAA